MKIEIKSVKTLIPGSFYWRVTIDNKTTNYADAAGAYTYAKKYLKRYYKESAAFSMLARISTNLLSEPELAIVKKLRRTRCKGLSPKQYGYLTGIYERQMREW